MIACVVVPHFAAKLERAHNPLLRGIPLIVIRYGAQRGKVVALSSEAEASGVHIGMTLSRARALCPSAVLVSEDAPRHEHGLEQVLNTLWTFTNRVEVEEVALPHTLIAYLDLGQLNATHLRDLSERLLDALIREVRMDASIGVAPGKFPAYVAAVTDHPLTFVAREMSAAFVAPHPIHLLPLDKETERRLALLAFRTIGQIAALPREALVAQFGKPGKQVWLLAQGLDGRPVKPRRLPQTEHSHQTFDDPLTEQTVLDVTLRRLADELARKLEQRGAALHALRVTVQLKRGQTFTEQLHLLQPVASAQGIVATVQPLLARMPLQFQDAGDGVISVEISLTHLVSAQPRQLELFTHKPARQELIDLAAVLAQRYGDCFYEAVTAERGAILPERRFRFQRIEAS
ncbi:MAG: hypothetical protein IPO91_03200 [Chloroflexi bacterium]|nr:hypothetical protein [Chloroflexota bacterium]